MRYDIFTTKEELLSIEIIDGKINSYKNKNITKKGIRLFENNKIYSTSVIGDLANSALIEKAVNSKGVGVPYDYELPIGSDLSVVDSESLKVPLTSLNESIELSKEYISKITEKFIFNGKFERSFVTRQLQTSNGRLLEQQFGFNEWYFLFKRVGSPQLMDGFIAENGRQLKIKNVFEKNSPFLNAYRNEIQFKSGRYPVFFIESRELIDKISESLIAERYFEGAALFSGKMNTKIFSSEFSLYDLNYSPDHGLYKKFDDEGTIRKISQLSLIENGIFKNVIADLRTAKKYGIESTGNGFRTPSSAVTTQFNNLVFGSGKRSTQEILNSLENCIIVFMANGGDFTDKGDYSTPLQLSYLMKNGEIAGRLPQLTVKTTTQEMFGSRLIEIANDGFQENILCPSLFTEMDVYLN